MPPEKVTLSAAELPPRVGPLLCYSRIEIPFGVRAVEMQGTARVRMPSAAIGGGSNILVADTGA